MEDHLQQNNVREPEHRPSRPPPAPSACTPPLTTINTSTISGALTPPPISSHSGSGENAAERRSRPGKPQVLMASAPDFSWDCADQLCQVVCYIFNLSLERVPVLSEDFLCGSSPQNFAPQEAQPFQTLTSHLMKALERIVLRHLRPAPCAFNTIHPSLLRVKLQRARASDRLAAWVTNYLTDRPQFVRLQDCVSDVVVCSTEGNDCEYRKVIMDFVKSVPASKTKEMVIDFSRKPSSDIASENIQGLDIERVWTYKYQGVHLINKLDWTDNTDSLYKRLVSFAVGGQAEVDAGSARVVASCSHTCSETCCRSGTGPLLLRVSSGCSGRLDAASLSCELVDECRDEPKRRNVFIGGGASLQLSRGANVS
ncbi:hypothetical protein L3Q82_012267 [Scortum barcoo]|uniref:Uncharacterized protein n=1 Tax=Scortum barcoo TaxID=214431 RepID=A0ACB8W3V3_9TELE|nr:hypothetical protein L3Q82_012267 [Scortum barcoo]